MFDKYLKAIIEDEQSMIYVATAMLVYILCFTNLIPNEIKVMFKHPIIKISSLSLIAYFSSKNFESALLLTVIFFSLLSCSNVESFNLLEKVIDPDDPEKISYSLNSMNKAISTSANEDKAAYSILNQGVYGGSTKTDIESIAMPADAAAGRAFNGRCYRDPASVDSAAETANNIFSRAYNTFVEDTNTTATNTEPPLPRCGPNLMEIDVCALNDNGYPGNPGEVFKACAASFAKREIMVCQFTNENGECLDEENGSKVENCSDPNSSECTAPKLAQAIAINSTTGPFESINIESIKNSYLLNIPDKTKAKLDEDGNVIKKVSSNQKKDVNGNLIYKVINSENVRLEKPNPLVGSFLNIPMRKLHSNYEYSYDWKDKDEDESIVIINVKNIQTNELININNIDISTENTYFLPGNMKVTNEEGMFLDEEGNSVDTNGNNITEENAANKFHPKFQNPVMEYEIEYENEDLYSYIKPFDAGISLDRFSYKPSDLDIYKEATRAYSEEKLKWENATARKIMRTIGCHRLRSPDSHKYGYWNTEENKCSYEANDITESSEVTQ